jgi:hypothetical protein
MPPARLPQCLEPAGKKRFFRLYKKHNRDHLSNVHIVFVRGEGARQEVKIEREELEVALQVEYAERSLKEDEED